MAEVTNGVGTNGTSETTNRVKGKGGKPKSESRAARLDALWKRFSERSFSLKGEVAGQTVTERTDGFPDDTSPEGVIEHFRENGAKATRKVGVGAASGSGKGECGGEEAAELAEILIDVPT
jgi:hypothetical protein